MGHSIHGAAEMATILIVEDEREMARGLRDLLEFEHHQILLAPDGATALRLFQQRSPDLVVLDLMLPDMDGMDVCRQIRARNGRVPILMLTARGQEHDIVRGFEAGVDDYVTKPFSVAELLARVRALIRRSQLHPAGGQEVSIGDIVIDTDQFVMRRGAVETPLTFYEVEILKLLYANQNQPVHRDTIFKKIWGMESDPTNRTVDNFIAKLRKKIETDQKKPRHLITVYGMGYKLIP
jgi:two-component system alkaline phosphatase synthesis response regulator PhoP